MILSVAILAQVIERSIHLPIRTRVAHQQWRRRASIRGGGNAHVMKRAQALTVRKSVQTYRGRKKDTREEPQGQSNGRKGGITVKIALSAATTAVALVTVCRTVKVKQSSSNRERHQQISPC